jgi:hypothetical protein
MNFSIWIGLLILALSIVDDLLVVFYMRRVISGDRVWAGILSGVVTSVVCLEVVLYAPEPYYIPFNAFGSVIGTPLAMFLDDKLPRRRRRDDKGRFKPIPVISKEPL